MSIWLWVLLYFMIGALFVIITQLRSKNKKKKEIGRYKDEEYREYRLKVEKKMAFNDNIVLLFAFAWPLGVIFVAAYWLIVWPISTAYEYITNKMFGLQ